METQEFIPIPIFCIQHGVEVTLINSLQEFGLIELVSINEVDCIPINQLEETEKMLRLHSELEINLEGIDAVQHLLQRVKEMRSEIQALKNRLSLYE